MDFSAYREQNIDKYNGKLKGLPEVLNPKAGRPLLFFVIVFLLLFPSLLFLGFFIGFFGYGGWVLLSIPFLCIGLWIVLGKLTKSGYDFSIRMALFAERNNFKYQMNGGNYDPNGYIKSVIGTTAVTNLVLGKLGDYDFSLFTTFRNVFFVVLKIGLPNNYPHIFLDSKTNNFIVMSNVPLLFPEDSEINLEGNFPEYFRVFSSGSKAETLQILSPELMQRMINYPKHADIEIVGSDLQIFLNYKTLKEDDMRMIFESAEQILNDIGSSSNNSRVNFDYSKRLENQRDL